MPTFPAPHTGAPDSHPHLPRTMNLISKLLPPSNIVLDLEVSSKKRMFEQAGLIFENNQGLARSLVFDSLFARERLGSTGLGQGVAIPHGRIKGLREAVAAFVRLGTPVPFDAPDGKPVNLLFILLVPEQATELHLQILSELAQMFSDPSLREQLTKTQDAGGLHQLISSWQSDVTTQHSAAV
jgi:PTS system nitrogen regulatory IIA component